MSTAFNDNLVNYAAAMGTERSKAAHTTFAAPTNDANELDAAYRGSWLPRAVIDRRADDSTRKWREWQDLQENDITLIEREEKRLQLKDKTNHALKMAALYGGSVMYMHIKGEDTAEEINVSRINRGDLEFVTVFTRNELTAGDREYNPLSPYFRLPKWYTITGATNGEQIRIHPSRLVRFVGVSNPAATDGFGDSRLIPIMDTIKQYLATAANISEMTYEAKIDVMKVKGLTEMAQDAVGIQKVRARYLLLAELKSTARMMVIDYDGEDFEQKTLSFAGLPDVFDRFQQAVCGAAQQPAAILFGKNSGGMGSTGDLELSSYYDSVSSEQENIISPALDMLDKVLFRSTLGRDQGSAFYNWRSLWQMSDKERAEIGKLQADTVSVLAGTGLYDGDALATAGANMFTESSTLSGLEITAENDESDDDAGLI